MAKTRPARGVLVAMGIVAAALGSACSSPAPDHRQHEQHGQQIVGPVAASPEEQRAIDGLLAATRASTEVYRDVEQARRDGFRQVTGVLAGSAAHLVSQQNLDDGRFDPSHPEMLLYDHGFELVGVAFMLPMDATHVAPAPFTPLGNWHEHDFHRSCLTARVEGPPHTVRAPDATCRAQGDVVITPQFWMLHVWLYRHSPAGMFAEYNRTVGVEPMILRGQP